MWGSYSYSWTMNAIADKANWAKFDNSVVTTGTTGQSSYGDLKSQFKNTARYADLSSIDEQSMTAWAKVVEYQTVRGNHSLEPPPTYFHRHY